MPDHAAVHSIEALERFRSALVIYQEKATASLHEILHEVTRTRNWLQNVRLPFWKSEISRIQRNLDDARQQLFRAELSEFRETSSAEERQVRRLSELKRSAEDKLRLTEIWLRQFDTTVGPLVKPVERQRSTVEGLTQAIHSLSEMIKLLEAYAEVPPPQTSKPSAVPESAAADTETTVPGSP